MTVTARGVTVQKQNRTILNQVDLHATAGQVTGLIGPNGAGKSTLLSALAGDIQLAHGVVEVAGKDASESTASELARTRAVMLQDVSVAFSFLVRDVVEMGRHPWGRGPDDAAIVDAALDATGITHLQDREIATLSGGERARAAFARVLTQQTQVVLLDEPTAAMDVHFQEQTMGAVRALARRGVTVIVVLHDLQLAARYCDRVVCLKAGEITAAGTVDEVYNDAILSSVYDWPITVLRSSGRILVAPDEAGEPVSGLWCPAPAPPTP
ncbi:MULTISPECIES: heme ABC transporter ATP-binding protein [unclassified Corynebacterium]|uniref:heme ABC transporter ATP-binding protein n=1 Tax=Corynebacterium TaxID=1716 RepID=UPI001EF23D1F|nr:MULTISPECIES: heme ABC transporter ATP-binding protein [unclassified Corynebacterium]MCG7288570.1 heme ABC transporter ATP-binding protein [Corynebacterium sp. ACRPZ]MCG7293124.1 heme ABC transporter ATP-binding protein [Corynebacterium sp. ACRPY]MCG7295577.1 heme ABC transporter ATP-binding protein [Corynebacterium afermentans]